jgi:nucleoid-associated protein YgaU
MSLRDKYNHAIQTAKGFRMEGAAEERDGKLYFRGTVPTQDQPAPATHAAPPAQSQTPQKHTTYTVKAGDTLSKIAKEFLGDANAYMDIFNANKDQLSDPNLIKPGQILKIPQPTHK